MKRFERARTVAVLLAAGEGVRTGGRKQFRRTGGRTVLEFAAHGLCEVRAVDALVVVVPADAVAATSKLLEKSDLQRPFRVVAGGATRNASSRKGVSACPESCEWVLIHDAARPFASVAMIGRVLRAARKSGAAVPAIAVPDSILEVDGAARLRNYLDRSKLRAVQTPQAFSRDVIERAFAKKRSRAFTDDASVVRAAGMPVAVVEGDAGNRKITTAEDLETALRFLRSR